MPKYDSLDELFSRKAGEFADQIKAAAATTGMNTSGRDGASVVTTTKFLPSRKNLALVL
jgi:hypothetical protein